MREVRRLGRWPTRLAEGNTALIPKEGPAGAPEHPPAHGPVHGLPAVAALGGRHCVAGVLGPAGGLWFPPLHERPGWAGGDGGPLGAVSPPWMGLCGDEGRLVTFFNLIPWALVLALVLELSMDPGTCRALGVMYRQLRQAFKIAGALGLWWHATNGILQGCPL